jgi:hypothetical protein
MKTLGIGNALISRRNEMTDARRTIRTSWLVALLTLAPVISAAAAEGPDVYLLIGQSNMAGRAPIPDDAKGPLDRCVLLNADDAWEPATNPLNRYSTIRKSLKMQKLGPGWGFARAMLEADPKARVGLVVNAKGGSRIEEWKRGAKFYKEAVRRALAAAKAGTLRGVVWHQGESNAKDPDYLAKLRQLVLDLRADLKAPGLPFVAGQVAKDSPVNAQLAKLPQTVPGTACVPVKGLKTLDGTHFDAAGQLELGRRYAEAMRTLQMAK